jgi:hypothetical protein
MPRGCSPCAGSQAADRAARRNGAGAPGITWSPRGRPSVVRSSRFASGWTPRAW